MKIKLSLFAASLLFLTACTNTPIMLVNEKLFDPSQSDSLGLEQPEGLKTVTVFKAQKGLHQYNHGAVLFPFKGQLYAQWQSSAKDEDAADTQVLFSRSANGEAWSAAKVLVKARPNTVVTNGGWWSDGNTLLAYINVWPKPLEPRGGYVEYITSTDGETWTEPKPVTDGHGKPVMGVIEQDLKQLPSGRVLTALHQQPGLILKPFYTDDPLAISSWQTGQLTNLPHKPEISREIEPSWFFNKNSEAVMVFRDQASSFKVLASRSSDNAQTWSTPVITNMPDSRAKQSAGNLPNGTAFIVNNPSGSKARFPLVVTLSDDGFKFNRAFVLRSFTQLQPMRFEGKYKRIGYSYPKSIIWRDSLWVSYAVNKEDIAVTRVPINSLK